MKNAKAKAIALVTVGFILSLSIFPQIAHAEKPSLPFELKAPSATALELAGGDSPTTMCFAWDMDSAMTQYFAVFAAAGDSPEEKAAADKQLTDLGADDIWIETQIDWAIDDGTNGWHYTNAWDDPYGMGYGNDENGQSVVDTWSATDALTYARAVNSAWIMRGGDAQNGWEPDGVTPGLKNLLPAGSYTLNTSGDNWELSIDYSQHTVYARARYAVTVRTEDQDYHYFSSWSPVASYGKNATTVEPLTPSNITAPVISNLRTADYTFNDNPVVLFHQEVPAVFTQRMVDIVAKGGEVRLCPEVSLAAGEWVEVDPQPVQTGDAEVKLIYLNNGKPIPAGTPMDLRCRYLVLPGDGSDDFYSKYSNVISFTSDDIDVNGGTTTGDGSDEGDNGNTDGNENGGGNGNGNGNQSGTITDNRGNGNSSPSNANANTTKTSTDGVPETSDTRPLQAALLITFAATLGSAAYVGRKYLCKFF